MLQLWRDATPQRVAQTCEPLAWTCSPKLRLAPTATHAGHHMAAAQPQRQQTQWAVLPRRRLVGRCQRALHPRWVYRERRGVLRRPGEVGKGVSRGRFDDLWFFSREAGLGVECRHMSFLQRDRRVITNEEQA